MNNKIKDNSAIRLEWLLTWLVIFFSGSAYAASNNSFYGQLKYLATFGIGAGYLIKSRGKIPLVCGNRRLAFWIPATWCLICFGNWVVHNDQEFTQILSRILHLVLAYEVICIMSWDTFKKTYSRSIVVICAISLVCFSLLDKTSLFSIIMPRLTGFTESGVEYTKYQGFLVYFKTGDRRNYGAFWEPGLFATHIICAFLMLPYIDMTKSKKILMYAILIITLLTTASSAGYVLLIMAIICNLLNRLKIQKKRDYLKLVIVFVLLGLLIGVYLNQEAIFKMMSLDDNLIFEKILHVSESQRSESVRVNFEAFLQEPLLGFGFSNLEQASSYKALGNSLIIVDTATTFRLLAAVGIAGIFFTAVLISGILRRQRIQWFAKIVLVVITLLIINKEAHDSFLLAWCLAMYMNEERYYSKEW